jgi:hypothetical protein
MKCKFYFKNGSFILREEKSNTIYDMLRISRHKIYVAFLIKQVAISCQQ